MLNPMVADQHLKPIGDRAMVPRGGLLLEIVGRSVPDGARQAPQAVVVARLPQDTKVRRRLKPPRPGL